MRIFFIGASGVTGRAAVPQLLAAGHDVVGLVRDQKSRRDVASWGAEPHTGDVFDIESLKSGMNRCDVVINAATRVPDVFRTIWQPRALAEISKIRTVGAANVAHAAAAMGVGRLIQQSFSAIYVDQGDAWVNEDSPVDVTRETEPIVVAEQHARDFGATAGTAICLRFGLITGLDRNTQSFLRHAKRGMPYGMGRPEDWIHVLHPDDLGTSLVAALDAPGGIYNVGAEPVRRRDYVAAIAEAAHRSSGFFFPEWVLKLGGFRIEMLTRSLRVSSTKLARTTDWEPRHPSLDTSWFDE